ncbi:MAG TPA: histidine--tRNA ligase [Candidatus Saccharimonadales bacterium]|nr:histidine--tRNA ligase [Candidatus Saccharimonadales bacterium]
MALSTQPYKGARDFYPEDKRLQRYIFAKLREVVERFGYEEYDAPVLEPLELYLAKTGEEIVNEQTYVFEDRGGRRVAIRPEMTPTVSRMVAAKRQELAYPLRWYSIPNLWRYERPQRGRLREHWQLNVDIFGVAGIAAEQEIVMVADAIFRGFGAKRSMYTIKLNSRKFIDYMLRDYLGLDATQASSIGRLIDRMHKIDRANFITQAEAVLLPSQREQGVVQRLLDVLDAKRMSALPQQLQSHPALTELHQMLELLKASGITNAEFDVTLMRGFDYYTDLVFEIFDTNPENNRSMMGGGRYDGLVGLFGVEPVPTVGFGFGDVTLANFLESHGLLPKLPSDTDLYVIVAGDAGVMQQALKPVATLREHGVRVAVDITGRKLDKQFTTAHKKGIHYALVIGEQELSEDVYTLKNLQTGTEEKRSIPRIVSIIQDYRHPSEALDNEL